MAGVALTGAGDAKGPRVGLVGAWFDPLDPKVWSGLVRNLIDQLGALEMFGGYRDATPWAPPARAVRRWLSATRRLDEAWPLTPEMRALSTLSNLVRRMITPRDVDCWVVAAGGFGLPVRGSLVSLSEISPSQLEALGPSGAAAFGLSEIGPRGLASVVRQRLRLQRRARSCCVVSSWAGDSLVADHGMAPEKVHVVGCGPNVEVLAPPARDWTAPRLLFVGNDWERKNGDAVLRAFRILHEEVPSARLDVVGGHPTFDVEGATGHGRVSFDDPQGRKKLEALFASATFFVMPSMIEPFGIVYVEAAAAGIASIATTVGTRDSVGTAGALVDPHDDAAILAAMRKLADPGTARSLGEEAKRRSALLTWRKTAERVVRAIDPQFASDRGFAEFL